MQFNLLHKYKNLIKEKCNFVIFFHKHFSVGIDTYTSIWLLIKLFTVQTWALELKFWCFLWSFFNLMWVLTSKKLMWEMYILQVKIISMLKFLT